jgi:hypothetical protein
MSLKKAYEEELGLVFGSFETITTMSYVMTIFNTKRFHKEFVETCLTRQHKWI